MKSPKKTALQKGFNKKIKGFRRTLQYRYKTLPHGQWIRLLVLLPGRQKDQIQCKLLTTDISDATKIPPYEPISYAWGDATDRREIFCEGRSLSITVSLHTALLRFRYKDRPRILWADGICINQNDDSEKGHQVEQMSKVYSLGEQTLVWLGDCTASDGIEGAFKLLMHYNDYSESVIAGAGNYDAQITTLDNAPPLPSEHPIVRNVNGWTKLVALLRRPWFSRLWVIQEVGLSARVLACCGKFSISISELIMFLLVYIDRSVGPVDLVLPPMSQAFGSIWIGQIHTRQKWYRERKFLQVLHEAYTRDNSNAVGTMDGAILVLDTGRKFQASDPRDHVYAFLSHPDLRGVMHPDYTMTVFDTFVTLFLSLVEKTGSLNALCYTDDLRKEGDGPSWLPLWYHRRIHGTINPSYFRTSNELGRFFDLSAVSVHDKSLQVEGLVVDTITEVTRTMKYSDWTLKPDESQEHILRSCWNLFRRIFENLVVTPSFAKSKHLLLLFTLAFGRYYPGGDRRYKEDLLAYCNDYCQELVEQWFSSDDLARIGTRGSSLNFSRWLGHKCDKRRFFITRNGRCGMGSDLTIADDQVIYVFGCDLPLFVHGFENSTVFRLVGPCYVDDILLGSTIEDMMKADGRKEKIVLV